MYEHDWYEEALEAFRKAKPMEWPDLIEKQFFKYGVEVQNRRPPQEVRKALELLVARVERESMAAPFMLISAIDGGELTPDDLVLNPAWSPLEVDVLWDVLDDGRAFGTMMIGVYRWDPGASAYVRDTNWGIMGNSTKRRPASPDDLEDRISPP